MTGGPGASVGEGACERATRWGELRRPRALAGGPERVRGEQAVRDAGLGREGGAGPAQGKGKEEDGPAGEKEENGSAGKVGAGWAA